MSTLEFPTRHVALLQELGKRLIDSRRAGTANESLARDLLGGVFEICMLWGLDGLLAELEKTFPSLDVSDKSAFADHQGMVSAVVKQLAAVDLDGGGPRNAKPRLLADAVVAALGLTLSEPADRAIVLDDSVRAEVRAALASVVDPELAVPRIRESVISTARPRIDERFFTAFEKIAAQLDERGMKIVTQPKLPIEAVHAVQRVLFEARNSIIDRVGRAAIDRAKDVIARVSPEAAARIDQPVSLRLTPRDVAILRACETRIPKIPAAVVDSLLESLTDTAAITWRAPEKPVRVYGASQTFAVGEVIEHPKFGRGEVVAAVAKRIDVEFADGVHTLVHVGVAK